MICIFCFCWRSSVCHYWSI